ncbi:MAG TPA: carcinine hydrolase/isopenicillin-N N-acyltransferase family protein, partial [Humisphaera sp.]|nr:carcinine hydrolase/isopenicillin-N N-acyltransferase family protein [Humisphaera sp.]
PTAMPYTLLYRTILERCKTVDEAIDLLEKTPRQTPNNLMLMDAAGNRAVVEIKPSSITVRRGDEASALISTNHQRGQDADTPGRCKRYDFLHRESHEQFGRVDVDRLEKMLAGASAGNMTLQSMVFKPGNRVIYLSAGRDAAHGSFHRLDLGVYFRP